MRFAVAIVVFAALARAQFKSTTQLVVAPVTVRDSKGHFVDGLTTDDLILTDNTVPQTLQMDWMTYPIDLVVAIQTSANSAPVIDKLGGVGTLFSQLLAGGSGATAMISFSDAVKFHQNFTEDPDAVTHSIRMLRKEGSDAHTLDAMSQALSMLQKRPPGRRRIILMIAEKRDRGSEAKLSDVMTQVQRLNATVYWVAYSPFLEPFTVKNKVAEDLKPIAERRKYTDCKPPTPTWQCDRPDETPVPYEPGPGGGLYAIGELARLRLPDLAGMFADSTGGRTLSFVKQSALENAIQLISQEVHRQYIVTFEPKKTNTASEAGTFHSIHVTVKNRPGLHVTTRLGYWAIQ
jgi:VWFA-related protein